MTAKSTSYKRLHTSSYIEIGQHLTKVVFADIRQSITVHTAVYSESLVYRASLLRVLVRIRVQYSPCKSEQRIHIITNVWHILLHIIIIKILQVCNKACSVALTASLQCWHESSICLPIFFKSIHPRHYRWPVTMNS